MSERRRYATVESIKQRSSMSAQIEKKDSRYGLYAGADLQRALTMSRIDTMLQLGLFPSQFIPFVKMYRKFLENESIAFFASTCSEISKLGFKLGIKDVSIKASRDTSK